MLHNVGAISSDRSLTVEEIKNWTVMEPEKVKTNIQKLIETNCIQVYSSGEVKRFYLTVDGIRKVLSMYS